MSKLIDLNSSTILSTQEEQQNELSQRGARKIGLFGSYSRGRFSSRSDLDFLVELEELSFDRYMNVKFFLEDLFQCKVDLVLEDTLKSRLRPHILSEVIYATRF